MSSRNVVRSKGLPRLGAHPRLRDRDGRGDRGGRGHGHGHGDHGRDEEGD
jgi:hypothetical protein